MKTSSIPAPEDARMHSGSKPRTLLGLATFIVVLSVYLLAGCQSANVTSEHQFASASAGKPQIVYVADFELAAYGIKHEAGLLSGRPGPVGRVGDRLAGASADPRARARQLTDLMANSLVKDLAEAGFNARRLQPGTLAPAQGWLVRGIFTEVQEGNRLRRALIGFGEGETDLQVVAFLDDLSQGPPKPLYEVATDATSGSSPGAAPTLVLSPYGAAARFVLAGKDLDKSVQTTAAQIARHIAMQTQTAK